MAIIPGNRYGVFLATPDTKRGPHNEILHKVICECGEAGWVGEYLLLTALVCPHPFRPLTAEQAMEQIGRCPKKVGDVLGFLTAEDRLYEGKFGPRWLCRCDCGARTVISHAQFKSRATSCGCMGVRPGDLAATNSDLQAVSFVRPRGKTPSFQKSMKETKVVCKNLSTGEIVTMSPLEFKFNTAPLPKRESRIIDTRFSLDRIKSQELMDKANEAEVVAPLRP